MAGIIFTISLISILTTVGFLFAWMVRLASLPEQSKQAQERVSSEFAKEPARNRDH